MFCSLLFLKSGGLYKYHLVVYSLWSITCRFYCQYLTLSAAVWFVFVFVLRVVRSLASRECQTERIWTLSGLKFTKSLCKAFVLLLWFKAALFVFAQAIVEFLTPWGLVSSLWVFLFLLRYFQDVFHRQVDIFRFRAVLNGSLLRV